MQLRAGRIGELFERETAAFEAANPRSRELFGRSGCSLFGGVPMSWMMMWAGGFPLFAASAEGSTITDVDGLTRFACAIYYRRVLLRSVKNFVLMGLAPALGVRRRLGPAAGTQSTVYRGVVSAARNALGQRHEPYEVSSSSAASAARTGAPCH